MENQPSSRSEATRIPALDGLRGIAILLVVLSHYHVGSGPFSGWLDAGWMGVPLFFVLSGFLITGNLLDARGSRWYFRRFYARRTLRIFPPFYAALAVWSAAGLVGDRGVWYWGYLANARMALDGAWPTNGLAPLWSLAVEEQFYLVWPAVVLFADRYLARVCVALAVGAFAWRVGLLAVGAAPVSIYVLTPGHLDALAAGSWLAVRARSASGLAPLRRSAQWLLPALVLAIVGTGLSFGTFSDLSVPMQSVGLTLLALAAAAAVLVAVTTQAWLLRSRVLRAYGRYSYTIYLWHSVLFVVLPWPRESQLLVYGVGLPALLALGWLSWRYFEAPVLRLGTDRAPVARGAAAQPASGRLPAGVRRPRPAEPTRI